MKKFLEDPDAYAAANPVAAAPASSDAPKKEEKKVDSQRPVRSTFPSLLLYWGELFERTGFAR